MQQGGGEQLVYVDGVAYRFPSDMRDEDIIAAVKQSMSRKADEQPAGDGARGAGEQLIYARGLGMISAPGDASDDELVAAVKQRMSGKDSGGGEERAWAYVRGKGLVEMPGAPAAGEKQDTVPEDIREQQAAIVDRMSGALGGLAEEGGEGASGISLGEALGSQAFWAGIGRRFVEAKRGILQLFSSEAEAKNLAKLTAEEMAAMQALAARDPRDAAAFNLGEATATFGETALTARAVPGAAQIPGLAGSGLPRAIGRILYSGTVGGGLAATQVAPDSQTKRQQLAVGAAIGAGAQAGVEALSKSARAVANQFTTKEQAKASGGMLKENPAYERGLALEQKTGVTLSPGQLSGSPALSEMRPPQEFVNKQAKQTLRYFVKLRDEISQTHMPSVDLAKRFADATDDMLAQMRETRKLVGDFRFKQFRGSVKAIDAGPLMKAMDDIAADAIQGTAEGGVVAMRNQLAKQLEASGGSLTPKQIELWRERFDKLLKGSSDIFRDLDAANQRRIGGQLMDGLYASLSQTADDLALSGRLSPANLLKQAVAEYKKYSAPINELKDSALGAIFKTQSLTPEAAAQRLMSLEPTQIRGVYKLLDEYYPQLIRQYQATKLYNAMRQSVATTSETAERLATQSKFNPKAALAELQRGDGLRAAFEADPKLLRQVQNGVALLDRVSDRVRGASGARQAVASRAAEIARNAFSGSRIFIAGTTAKVLGPVGLWKLTSTEKGRATLRTLATAPLNSARYAVAVEDLVLNLDDAPVSPVPVDEKNNNP